MDKEDSCLGCLKMKLKTSVYIYGFLIFIAFGLCLFFCFPYPYIFAFFAFQAVILFVAFLFFVIGICFSPNVKKDARGFQRALVWLAFLELPCYFGGLTFYAFVN